MHFSLENLLYRNMCAEEHPPRVCDVSREAGLSLRGQQVPLEGDEWKPCTNKRSNRPLVCCPEGKGLVTLLLEEDWDTHDLCTATISEENAYLRRLVRARTLLPRHRQRCISLLLCRQLYSQGAMLWGVISSSQVVLICF